MRIHIVAGVGVGPTELAAFDEALIMAGIANFNLIYLSSIIPPGSEIVESPYTQASDEYGQRLYVVMAKKTEWRSGQMAAAGIGWVQYKDGRGLFVEHSGADPGLVESQLTDTLMCMMENRNRVDDFIRKKVAHTLCTGRPVCALVAAVIKSEPW